MLKHKILHFIQLNRLKRYFFAFTRICSSIKPRIKKILNNRYYNKHHKAVLSIYFGVPGSGKTTFASYLVKRDLKHGCKVWSNVPITGAYIVEPKDDIGHYMLKDGRLIIDEAGIEYNNRDFKQFSKDSLYFYKYHRHYNMSVDIFSQGFDDMDKKLRTLAQYLYVVKKSIIPYFITVKRIAKKVDINELTKEIIDAYYFVPFSKRFVFTPFLWKMFNTHSRVEYPEKDWLTY